MSLPAHPSSSRRGPSAALALPLLTVACVGALLIAVLPHWRIDVGPGLSLLLQLAGLVLYAGVLAIVARGMQPRLLAVGLVGIAAIVDVVETAALESQSLGLDLEILRILGALSVIALVAAWGCARRVGQAWLIGLACSALLTFLVLTVGPIADWHARLLGNAYWHTLAKIDLPGVSTDFLGRIAFGWAWGLWLPLVGGLLCWLAELVGRAARRS